MWRRNSAFRPAAACFLAILLACASASGQGLAPSQNPYALDPYRPSDADLLRRYGSVLLAQTPLAEIRKLDPFNPSDAALLRELGGGIPLWGLWYPPFPGPLVFPSAASATGERPQINIFIGQLPPEAVTSGAAPSPSLPKEIITAIRPDSNDGVWIEYGNARWISSGQAVAFDDTAFMQIGEYNGFPVFQRRDGSGEVIYLPTRKDRVAPYRLKGR
jgi:hypothetical protein